MKELLRRVWAATGLDETAALPAIGHALQFMRDHAPAEIVTQLINQIPDAHQGIRAAAATSDAGVTAAIAAVKGLFGFGQTNLNVLTGKLANLGLNEKQVAALLGEVFAYAESLVGPEGVAKMRAAMPYLSGFMGKTARARPDV
ncbi:hypothetical protein [Methylocystis echinoides]|uniref:hypothetical protein n=1 Tax=Methylocystis echinoides TaxID=29468 RepID=UPI003417D2DD